MKKFLAMFLAGLMLVTLMASCKKDGDKDDVSGSGKKTFAFVAKDVNNPYMKKVFEGFEKICKEVGVTPLFKSPDQATAEKQIEIIDQLIAQKVALIAISGNDVDALQNSLQKAMNAGIKVISLDSAVNKDSRMVHIQQADPEQIGRVLVQAAHEMVNGDGGIAILSATAQATNQNLWIEWMKKEIQENPDKYAKTPIVTTVYGDDVPDKSTQETNALLSNKDVKVIIAPTTVGMLAAGKLLSDKKSEVKLTGLGLPSDMAPYIESGVCPWMYLWNPIQIGELAAHAGNALVKGEIKGEEKETFTAGSMGDKVVVKAADGGTEIMLGDPFKFDKDNIATWKTVY